MAITRLNPNAIHLGGDITVIDEQAAVEAITPGQLVEYQNNSGVLAFGLHDTADDPAGALIALEREELNAGISTAYASGDMLKVGHFHPGSTFYGFVVSGTYDPGALLQSNGDGNFKAADTGDVRFVLLESKTVTAPTRARIAVI